MRITFWQAAFVSSLAIALTFLLPALSVLNLFCCAGVVLGALLGPYLYSAQNRLPLTYAQGLRMGLLAGFMGGLWSLVGMLVLYELGIDLGAEVRRGLEELSQQESPDAAFWERVRQSTSGTRLLIFSGISNLLLGMLFGALGGALGAGFGARYTAPEDEP
jgi:hypothetical protein|nr:MAG: hypothetical protein KatS3mg041_1713 [Bacteroidota bacterium]